MTSFEPMSRAGATRAARRALLALAWVASLSCGGCMMMIPNDVVHRVSVDVRAHPKDLRACVVEAIRGIDGVPGVNPPAGADEQSLVEFRTTLPEVSGEVERQGDDGVRVSIQVVAHREPANFWQFAQPHAQAVADAIVARCGVL